jgi:methylated-DNA-[protein]-cysteine S-methyltransferase
MNTNTQKTTFFFSTFDTPPGEFSFAVNEAGAVVATAFGPRGILASRIGQCTLIEDSVRCANARAQVLEYFAGGRREFSLPLAAEGSAYQNRVWTALRAIPFGETRSYGELAAEIGPVGSARAVGRANATNPICLIVPCHRVIGADGSLTGFAFGEDIKRRLLEHEGALTLAAAR